MIAFLLLFLSLLIYLCMYHSLKIIACLEKNTVSGMFISEVWNHKFHSQIKPVRTSHYGYHHLSSVSWSHIGGFTQSLLMLIIAETMKYGIRAGIKVCFAP